MSPSSFIWSCLIHLASEDHIVGNTNILHFGILVLLQAVHLPHLHLLFTFKVQSDISFSLNAPHLNQRDESICLECFFLAVVEDGPRAGNDCTPRYGHIVSA